MPPPPSSAQRKKRNKVRRKRPPHGMPKERVAAEELADHDANGRPAEKELAENVGRMADDLRPGAPEPELVDADIKELYKNLTPEERAAMADLIRIALYVSIPIGPKMFWSSDGGRAAAGRFGTKHPEYLQLETGTELGKQLDGLYNDAKTSISVAIKEGRLPYAPPPGTSIRGYPIECWVRGSVRFTESHTGVAVCFPQGANKYAVQRNHEVPGLLGNPDATRIVFYNDDETAVMIHNDDGTTVPGAWERSGPGGTWEGPDIPTNFDMFSLDTPQYAALNTPIA